MLKILYGTTNKGKLQAMRTALESFDLEIVGLNDMEGELPIIEENGTTPLENAQIKAKAYYERFKMLVFPVTADCILMNNIVIPAWTSPFLQRSLL